jgi:hypothetical protein
MLLTNGGGISEQERAYINKIIGLRERGEVAKSYLSLKKTPPLTSMGRLGHPKEGAVDG